MKRLALGVGAVALSLGLVAAASAPADAAVKPAGKEKARCQMVRLAMEKKVEKMTEGKGISKARKAEFVEKLVEKNCE